MEEPQASQDSPTITDVVRNLVSPSTLPHVILIGFAGIILYLLSSSDSDSLFAIGIAGYIGLSIGYALTAWMQEMEVIHRFSHFQPIAKGASFVERVMLFFIRVLTSWISPILLGLIPFAIIAAFLNSETGSQQVDYWAMALGGLFVVWSLAQGRALSTSLRIFVEGRASRIDSIHRTSNRVTSTTAHMTIIGLFAAITYWALVSRAKNFGDMTIFEKLGPISFAIAAVAIQVILFRYTAERRITDSERKDTAAFGFAWGLFMQLFVTWHLLSALRRLMDDGLGIFLIIEEFILMLMTVIAAIWSLAKNTHHRGFKLFTKQNAIFWGMAFGMAYSGSIAMIAVLGSKISDGAIGTIGMSATIGIGHLITAGTMMWIHAWRIGLISQWLDSNDDVNDHLESEEIDEVVVETTTEHEDDEVSELDIPEPVIEDDEIELVDLD